MKKDKNDAPSAKREISSGRVLLFWLIGCLGVWFSFSMAMRWVILLINVLITVNAIRLDFRKNGMLEDSLLCVILSPFFLIAMCIIIFTLKIEYVPVP